MQQRFWLLIVCLLFLLSFAIGPGCSHARPPKPGPNFVWVPPHTTPDGVFIRGHWKYAGPPVPGKIWVPGHYNAAGEWVPGHWKYREGPPRKGAVWVPGHFGPGGKWIPGHWR